MRENWRKSAMASGGEKRNLGAAQKTRGGVKAAAKWLVRRSGNSKEKRKKKRQ